LENDSTSVIMATVNIELNTSEASLWTETRRMTSILMIS